MEYKINFLAALRAGELYASGRVARAGKRIIVTAAEVWHVDETGERTLCALMQQTLAVVPQTY